MWEESCVIAERVCAGEDGNGEWGCSGCFRWKCSFLKQKFLGGCGGMFVVEIKNVLLGGGEEECGDNETEGKWEIGSRE